MCASSRRDNIVTYCQVSNESTHNLKVITYGGSGLSRTVETIAEKAPKATVVKDAFTVHRGSVANCESDVKSWLKTLGY